MAFRGSVVKQLCGYTIMWCEDERFCNFCRSLKEFDMHDLHDWQYGMMHRLNRNSVYFINLDEQ
jgi:hypothetical protein